MAEARQTITVIMIVRKSNKTTLERRPGACRSRRKRNALYKSRSTRFKFELLKIIFEIDQIDLNQFLKCLPQNQVLMRGLYLRRSIS